VPACSIIIPVFNKAALTRQCLDAVIHTSGTNYEVIVVDDASSDDTQEMLKGYGNNVRVVTHAANKGFATSCNDGAAMAKGDFLVFLNNDTIPRNGWLNALSDYAQEHPHAAAVGAKLLFPDDTIQHAGMVVRNDRLPIHIYAGFPADHPAVNKSRRYQMLTGACLLVRRNLFESVNGFDTAFLNSHEDVDLCLRLDKAGYETHYCHTSEVYHLETSTRESSSASEDRNTQLYLSRWGNYVQPDDFIHYVEDGLITAKYSLLYPIRIHISPQLAVLSPWTDPHLADRILHHRSRQVYELLLKEKRAGNPLREPEACRASPTDGQEKPVHDGEYPEAGIQEELKETRMLLRDAHEQLMLRDEMQLQTDQIAVAEKIKKLVHFLDQIDTATDRLYRSGRWHWANPMATVRGWLSGARSRRLPGYGRLDDVLNSYRAWRDRHPGMNPERKQ